MNCIWFKIFSIALCIIKINGDWDINDVAGVAARRIADVQNKRSSNLRNIQATPEAHATKTLVHLSFLVDLDNDPHECMFDVEVPEMKILPGQSRCFSVEESDLYIIERKDVPIEEKAEDNKKELCMLAAKKGLKITDEMNKQQEDLMQQQMDELNDLEMGIGMRDFDVGFANGPYRLVKVDKCDVNGDVYSIKVTAEQDGSPGEVNCDLKLQWDGKSEELQHLSESQCQGQE